MKLSSHRKAYTTETPGRNTIQGRGAFRGQKRRRRPSPSTKSTVPVCTHCTKRGHSDDKCYSKHPELAPKRAQTPGASACVTEVLITETPTLITQAIQDEDAVQAFSTGTRIAPTQWICDTACDTHMISSPDYFIANTARPHATSIRTALNTKNVLDAKRCADGRRMWLGCVGDETSGEFSSKETQEPIR
ncbi:uncharacterized protein N7515_002769 [Penicillium bovifimosum]|uniref:Uncharacterized protein n=1 Tax=Penicillium bovifimosum TaxID=126998 RepID=A0A9W9HC68_9EURO|nr:uncharacterized protein N7515_002769 [Penicillium bovifimosum]KAJ5143982.1 hypothetical protein N7515_002769 [Penicillium bovifimosum]